MDKRLVGKWYKSEMGETLNILSVNPPRLKMSFSSSGYYNFDPNCVYEKDGFLCYEINDEYYRMVYYVKLEGDCLEGYYTQHGKKTPVRYERVSEVPDDEPYRFVPAEIYVPETEETRTDILKRYAEYDKSQPDPACATEDRLGGDAPDILQKYGIFEYLKDADAKSDEIVFKLLDFVCDHFHHDGGIGLPSRRKIEDIIEFCEHHNGKTNCRGLAILLASLLRLYGIKARHITCMPYEDPFNDCHVVVDCLLPSGKRVMLDPTYRLFLMDLEGRYVSLRRLRRMLIDGEAINANENASRNGTKFDKEGYRNYMTKNTFRFSRGTVYADGSDERDKRRIQLIPANYPVEKFSDSTKAEFVYDDEAFWEM